MYNVNWENEFFIIDSDNLGKCQSGLYGYVICDNHVYLDYNVSDNECLGNGFYVSVECDSDCIVISQDCLGSFGLYLFEVDDYFAVSNSFLKLVDFLKSKYSLSLNENFVESFISCSSASFSFDETLINEIKVLPWNYKMIIGIKTKKVDFVSVDIGDDIFVLDSKEGISSLDSWFNKWIVILRNIVNNGGNLSFDLSNNLGSRVLLSLLLNSNISLDNVFFNIVEDLPENRNIISQIMGDYNFDIENNIVGCSIQDWGLTFEKSFITNQGFHKQSNYMTCVYDEPLFSLNNEGRRLLNNYPKVNIVEYIENTLNYAENYSNDKTDVIEKYLWENIHKVQKNMKIYDINSEYFTQKFYMHTIFRQEYGKKNIQDFLNNKINLEPLFDINLQKIKTNNQKLLLVLILTRYSPQLLEYDLEDEVDNDLLKFARKINRKYPYIKKEYPSIKKSQNKKNTNKNGIIQDNVAEIHDFISKIFNSNSFKHTFLKYFPKEIYTNISKSYVNDNPEFYGDVYAMICIIRTIEDIEYSQYNNQSELDWLKSFNTINNFDEKDEINNYNMLTKYITARVDIKNEGNYTNQVKILDISDNNADITTPSWFFDDKGEGMCINSNQGKLSLKLKCINDGNLNINLRTLDVRDRMGNRFPVYIDYLKLRVDDNEILNENKLTWHDNPVIYNKKVFNDEIVRIEVKWQPFSHISKYK